MQGQFAKKREEQQLFEEQKKKQVHAVHAILSTEGPMQLKDESRKIEEAARVSFEKSVGLELDAIKKRLREKLKKKKRGEDKKKPRYGWAVAGAGSEPPAGDDSNDGEGEEKK